MRYGMPYSTWYGSPTKVLAYVRSRIVSGSLEIVFSALKTGWYGIYVNAKKAVHTYATANVPIDPVRVPLPWGSTSASVHVMPLGNCGDKATDFSHVARGIEAGDSKRVTLQLAFAGEVVNPDAETDAGYTSSWSLVGLSYADNVERVPGRLTYGRLDCVMVVSAGTLTISLNCNGKPVASGTATVASLPAAVTLAESNSSGLSGSVTVAAAVATRTFDLFARWPKSIKILRDTTNPPTTTRATILFTGRQALTWTESSDLTAGTHYYKLTPTSDTGTDGTSSSVLTVVTVSVPGAPTSLAYKSGAAAATVLQFTASPTSGATYRAYLQNIGVAVMDFETIAATAIAGATQITLPAITGYAGTARVVVRAVKSGIEDQNVSTLELEYDSSGVRVVRPNQAGLDMSTLVTTAGLAISIAGRYDSNNEAAVATTLKLFSRAPSGTYNYASAESTVTLAAVGAGVKAATLTATFVAAGWRFLRAVAYTAAGVSSEPTDCPEISVYVSDGAVAAPNNVQAHVSRG